MSHSIRITRKPGTTAQPAVSMPPRSLRLMSVQGAADYAKVSTQTVRRAIKAGDLKTYRIGRQIRIDESDLVNYLSSQCLKWL
jgi:excisionase family DNA binding protein